MLVAFQACSPAAGTPAAVGTQIFPLGQVASFYSPDDIRRLAASDDWYAIATPSEIVAVDGGTQTELWRKPFKVFADLNSPFLFGGDTLVAATLDEVVLADRSGATKNLVFDPLGGTVTELVAAYRDFVFLIRGGAWALEAYDVRDGRRQWVGRAGRGGTDVFLEPAEKVAYVATRDYGLSALDNATGSVIWKEDRSSLHNAYENHTLYSVTRERPGALEFSAFDVTDRVQTWHSTVEGADEVHALTILGRHLVASGTGGLMALDKNSGDLLWRTNLQVSILSRPTQFEGIIYARALNETVYAFSPETGEILGLVPLERPKVFTPSYEARAAVYTIGAGIVFNNRHAVLVYAAGH